MKSLLLSSVLVLSLALLFLVSAENDAEVVNLAPGGVETSDSTVFTIPDTVTVLTGENFDSYVFNQDKPSAWIIFAYTPYCTHCRNMMPQFLNASKTVEEEMKLKGCRFALVNGAAGSNLIDRFDITSYPTILYTTGKDKGVHKYQGGHTFSSLVHFGEYLYRALETGSFATDVTSPAAFALAEKESGDLRVPFYVFVPASAPQEQERKREAGWNVAVDGAASMGNTRFAVIYENALPDGWEEEGSASYKAIVKAARDCQKKNLATGPSGEVLVTVSDRVKAPICYRGPWLTTESGAAPAIHPLLQLYVAVNGFHAVEEVNVALFSLLEAQQKHYMGFIITDGPVMSANDTNYVPVLRAMSQDAAEKLAQQDLTLEQELEAPRVSWTYVDGRASNIWRIRYDVQMKDLPAFLIVDAKRDRMFCLRTRVPRFEQIKNNVPWKVGGEQHQLLQQFVDDVLADKYYGEKTSLVGRMAEYLSHYSVLNRAYSILRYDDFTFIIVIFAAGFFMFLMFIGCVAEPIMEHYDEVAKRKEEQEKRKKEEEKKKKE